VINTLSFALCSVVEINALKFSLLSVIASTALLAAWALQISSAASSPVFPFASFHCEKSP